MKKSPTVKTLVSKAFIEANALPSNITYGKAIHGRKAVKIIEATAARVEAWVGGLDGKVIEGGGSKRRVEFTASKAGLRWHCTGNPKDHQVFCKHCVALALALLASRKKS